MEGRAHPAAWIQEYLLHDSPKVPKPRGVYHSSKSSSHTNRVLVVSSTVRNTAPNAPATMASTHMHGADSPKQPGRTSTYVRRNNVGGNIVTQTGVLSSFSPQSEVREGLRHGQLAMQMTLRSLLPRCKNNKQSLHRTRSVVRQVCEAYNRAKVGMCNTSTSLDHV